MLVCMRVRVNVRFPHREFTEEENESTCVRSDKLLSFWPLTSVVRICLCMCDYARASECSIPSP